MAKINKLEMQKRTSIKTQELRNIKRIHNKCLEDLEKIKNKLSRTESQDRNKVKNEQLAEFRNLKTQKHIELQTMEKERGNNLYLQQKEHIDKCIADSNEAWRKRFLIDDYCYVDIETLCKKFNMVPFDYNYFNNCIVRRIINTRLEELLDIIQPPTYSGLNLNTILDTNNTYFISDKPEEMLLLNKNLCLGDDIYLFDVVNLEEFNFYVFSRKEGMFEYTADIYKLSKNKKYAYNTENLKSCGIYPEHADAIINHFYDINTIS